MERSFEAKFFLRNSITRLFRACIYKVNPFATVTTSLHARADLKLTRTQVYKSPHRNTMATSDMSDKEDHPKNEESGKPYPTSTGLGFGNAAAVPSDEDIVY